MLTEFLAWWAERLRSLLPGRRNGTGRSLLVALLASASGPPVVELTTRRRNQEGTLGRFTLDGSGIAALRAALAGKAADPAVLRLPSARMLEQQIQLPLAAERELERVLSYEMDRLTPFAADDLYWAGTVDRRDRARGRLHVRLLLVLRAEVAPLLDALAQAGVRPAVLEAGTGREVALERPQAGSRRTLAVAATTCAVLAVVAAATPFVRQSQASQQVEDRIAALRPAVDRAEALRRTITANAAGADVIVAQRARSGDALGMLALLTDLLPDDTHLNDVAIRSRMVTMSGQSGAAARLIAALAADPAVRNPAFSAPVTREDGGRAEGFSIRAEIAP